MSLATCLAKFGDAVSTDDRARLAQHIRDGMNETQALETLLREAREHKAEIVASIEEAGGTVRSATRPVAPPDPPRVAQVRRWLAPVLKALEPIARASVVETTAELPDPNAPPDVEGVYTQDGEVYFVAANIPNAARALEVGRHEVFGHMAIERNGNFKARLDAVQRAIRAGNFKPLVREVRARQGLLPAAVEAREVVALMAERGVKSPLLASFRSALREVGRDLGLDMPVDEAELTALVGVAARDLKRDAALMRDFRAAQGLPAVQALNKADPTESEILAAIDAIYGTEDTIDSNNWRRAPSGKRVRPGMFQRAFHGSPHEFERFSLEKIGTGEGAQVYGWGLYFSSKKEVAEYYREQLAPTRFERPDGVGVPRSTVWNAVFDAMRKNIFKHASYVPAEAADSTTAIVDHLEKGMLGTMRGHMEQGPEMDDITAQDVLAGIAVAETYKPIKGRGKLYEVEVPEDHELLEWDSYLEFQPDAIREKVRRALAVPMWVGSDRDMTYAEAQRVANTVTDGYLRESEQYVSPGQEPLWQVMVPPPMTRMTLRDAYNRASEHRYEGSDQATSEALRAAGAKGHKYKSGSSDVMNFVIYDDAAIETKAMYSRAGRPSYPLADRSEWYSDADFEARGGRLLWMSPDDFLAAAPPLEVDDASRDNVDALKRHIEEGGTLDPLALYPADSRTPADGRHRALAAKELGITPIPVLSFRGVMFSRAAALPGAVPNDIQALLERVMAPRESDMSLLDRARTTWRKLTDFNADAIRQGVIDSFDAVKQLEKGQLGALMDAAESPYKAALATRNLPSVMAAVMLRGVPVYKQGAFQLETGRKGVIEIFRPLTEHPDGNLLPLWELYAAGKRAKQLKKQGRERLFSDADITKALALAEQYPLLEEVAKEWETFNGQLLDLAVERGVLDPAAVKLWKANFYVPFYRAMEEAAAGGEGPKAKRGLEGHGGAAVKKRLKGGEEKLGDVFENMLMNTAYLIDESFKNTAMQKIAAIGEGVAMEKIPLKWDAVQLPAGQLEKALDQLGGMVLGFKDDPTSPTGKSWQPGLEQSDREEWLKLFRRVAPVGKDVVAVYEGGKPVYYRVTDDLLLRSISNMGFDNFSDVFGLFRGSKRLLTGAITLDPAFMMANWVRDTLSTWVTSDAGIVPVIDALKGVKAALAMDSEILEMMAAGAGGGGIYDMQPTELRTFLVDKLGSKSAADKFMGTIVSPKNWLRAWRRIGNAAENANRVAVYKAVRAAGGSVAEAAYQARDVLNFTMSGDYAAMRWLTATVPFMNARIQGLYRLWRGAQDHPLGFAMKGLALTAATLALLLKNNDDEEYEQLPEWDRDMYWHFFVGGEHYRLPKPFEVGAIFGTIPERMFRLGTGRDSADIAKERVMAMLGETFAFNPIPQLAKPLIEQYANKSFFTGSPIVGLSELNLEPEAQYTPWTSETMKLMAEAMPDFAPAWLRSPRRLEALMRAYLGATGTYALQAADTLAREASGAPPRPARKIYDMPVVKRFMQDPNPRYTKYADQLYTMLEEANSIFRTVNRYREEGRLDDARALIEENRGKLAARTRLNRVATRVRALNNQIQLTLYSPTMTPEAKRARLDELTARKNEVTARVAPLTDLF